MNRDVSTVQSLAKTCSAPTRFLSRRSRAARSTALGDELYSSIHCSPGLLPGWGRWISVT